VSFLGAAGDVGGHGEGEYGEEREEDWDEEWY
jgi:hypothetical protein